MENKIFYGGRGGGRSWASRLSTADINACSELLDVSRASREKTKGNKVTVNKTYKDRLIITVVRCPKRCR